MESSIVRTQMGPIEYTLLGNGPIILVCHGTSSNCFSHPGYAPLIEAGYSMLTPSRPGYGRTKLQVGASAHEAAAAMIALLDALAIKKCTVMAISGGGPTGISLAAEWPERVERLILLAAVSHTQHRMDEPEYRNQMKFYGRMHNFIWFILQVISRISPKSMAKQTMALFSAHDTQEVFNNLSAADIQDISRFYQNRSSRKGALLDFQHTVGMEIIQKIQAPVLVAHSREDRSVPFRHAEWSLKCIPHAEFCEGGITGHFLWLGPDYQRISQRIVEFLRK